MTLSINATSWVYVVVQNPGGDEQIVGQHDAGHDIDFIPAFADKEAAVQGVEHIAKTKGRKYEIQAIMYQDLMHYAAAGRFLIFILDGHGTILAKHAPHQSAS